MTGPPGGDSPGDRDLVTQFLRTRSERAFRALYRRYSPRLYAVALRLSGGDAALADDLLQDVWISAVEALETFRWDASLPTWLTGILMNHLRSHWRRAARAPGVAYELERVPDPAASGVAERVDLERAVARLPHGYRSVLVLYGVHGYSHAEISRLLRISEGTSKSQLSRARRALRGLLRVDADGPPAWEGEP